MRIRTLAVAMLCAATLCAQHHRFSWQEACFKNPAAPFCAGNEFAVKNHPPAKGAAPRNVTTDPFPSTPEIATPSVIVVGGIDWRFADPSADAIVGFNFNGLSASPLARGLIAELGSIHGFNDADVRKIFDGLTGAAKVALSIRDNQIVAMVTGRQTDSASPAPQSGWKSVPISGNAMLIGNSEAVDQAVQRIATQPPAPDMSRANTEFWTVGSPTLLGPSAVNAGVKRFSLDVSFRNGPSSDIAFEFDGVPNATTLGIWQTTSGIASIEGKVLHFKTSTDPDEILQRFNQIAASPLGQRLAVLQETSRYLPAPDATPKTKPVIYGLDQ